MDSSIFQALFIIVPIFIVLVFIFVIAQFVSPKFRGKMMSRQIKSMKYMMDESKDDLESISTDMANATKGSIKTTAHAIKDGFTEDNGTYCKHCGCKIDWDSRYCKHCGKEQ